MQFEAGSHDSVVGRILRQCAAAPSSVAGRDAAQVLTYGDLGDRSARLASTVEAALREQEASGVLAVGVSVPRSVHLLTSLVAILRVGATYLPINADLPDARLTWIHQDASPRVLLTTESESGRWRGGIWDGALIAVDAASAVSGPSPRRRPPDSPSVSTPEAFRYLLYTSGSTGRPKGVIGAHPGLHNRLTWMQKQFALTPEDRILHKTPVSFDVSLWELLWPLMYGASVVLAQPGGHLDRSYLRQVIQERAVTVTHFVPSMLASFLEATDSVPDPCLESVRLVFTSGEALLAPVARRALESFGSARLYNLYGPTEASIDVTCHQARAADLSGPVPIGRAIDNMRTYVVGEDGRPVPPGTSGELWLAGVGLAEGYLNLPDRTARAFPVDPPHLPERRVYRTGDLVFENDQRELVYIGRKDRQVKFRGVRIELAEIEESLSRCPGVVTAYAALHQSLPGKGGDRLVAVVEPSYGLSAQTADLYRWPRFAAETRQHLAYLLPAGMLPTHFLFARHWPVTEHGKLDHLALDAALADALARSVGPAAKPVAETDVLTQVLGVFRVVLDLEDVAADDNFFEIGGGDSLSAVEATVQVEEYVLAAFGCDIASDAMVFIHPTAKGLSREIERIVHGRS